MKKFIFVFTIALVLISCGKSPEEKANELIKIEVIKTLYKPDTYNPVETKLDSAFSPSCDPELLKKMHEIFIMVPQMMQLKNELDDAQSSMAMWSNSQTDIGTNEYNKAKQKYENLSSQLESLQLKGTKIVQEVRSMMSQSPKFIGFMATHNYRADNNAGNTLIGNEIFIIDPEFKKVLFRCDAEEYNQIQAELKELEE